MARGRASELALVLVALTLGACDPVQVEPAEPAEPELETAPTPESVSYRIDPYAPPETARGDGDAVLFLPFINRSPWAIHPAWLRAFDRTLAAHAAVFEGHGVIEPELAGVVALELGFPDPWSWTPQADFTSAPETWTARARQVGASTVVWGEIGADGRVALHALGTSAARWDGVSIELNGLPDIAIYEGPGRLLEAIQGPIAGVSPPPDAIEVLASARTEAIAKDPATLRRVERTLAKLAAAHPQWAEPWVELAWVRQLRSLARNDFYSDWVAEGPSPGRHVARLFSNLSDVAKTRLDAIDVALTLSSQPRSKRLALAEALPPTAWERVALAALDGGGGETFALEPFTPRSTDERAMLAVIGAVDTDDAHAAAAALAAETETGALMDAPYLISILEAKGEHESDWALFRGASRLNAIHDGAAILELLRGACIDAGAEVPRCLQPIVTTLAAAGVSADADALIEPGSWASTLAAWRRSSLERSEGSEAVPLPDVSIFKEDPSFVVEWVMPAELVLAANTVLPVAARARGGVAGAADLLISPRRARLESRFDRLIDAVYVAPLIQAKRGDHDSVAKYQVWTRPFEGSRVADYWHSYLGQLIHNELEVAAATTERLAKVDPFDHRWRQAWLYWVDYRENISWDDSSSAEAARWLETLLPRPGFLTRDIARAWGDAGDPSTALQRFEELEQRIQEPANRQAQDDHLAALGRPIGERIERMAEGLARYPHSAAMIRKLTGLEIEAGRFASAEQRAKALLERPTEAQWACSRLVELSAWQGRAEEGGKILASCAAESENHWAAARAWVRYANGLADRDRFEEAAAAYRAAQQLIGGAGDVVYGMGKLAEITGNTDEAHRQFAFLRDQYGNGEESKASGRWELWQLYLRHDQVDEALAEIEPLVQHSWQSNHAWWRLLRTYSLKGDLAAYERLARTRLEKRFESGPTFGLAQLAAARGNADEAVALIERIATEKPKQAFWPGFAAEILIDAGRGGEAVDFARRAYTADPGDAWSAGLYVDALVATDRVDDAEQVARSLAARSPKWENASPLARVERARGKIGAARDRIAHARRTHPWGDAAWRAEVDRIPFEISLGLPKPESRALRKMSDRIDSALLRYPLESALWEARAAVDRHRGEHEAARVALTRANRLNARPTASERIARRGEPAHPPSRP